MKASAVMNSMPKTPGQTDVVRRDLARLREVTGQVMGSVFFGTLLKSMRESELKGAYGHGGRGEEVFMGQLHGVLAERMGAARDQGVGAALYQRMERQQQLISRPPANILETRV